MLRFLALFSTVPSTRQIVDERDDELRKNRAALIKLDETMRTKGLQGLEGIAEMMKNGGQHDERRS